MLIRKKIMWWTSYLQQKTSKCFCDRHFEVSLPFNFAVIDTISNIFANWNTYILHLHIITVCSLACGS